MHESGIFLFGSLIGLILSQILSLLIRISIFIWILYIIIYRLVVIGILFGCIGIGTGIIGFISFGQHICAGHIVGYIIAFITKVG